MEKEKGHTWIAYSLRSSMTSLLEVKLPK